MMQLLMAVVLHQAPATHHHPKHHHRPPAHHRVHHHLTPAQQAQQCYDRYPHRPAYAAAWTPTSWDMFCNMSAE